ncbi:hypothetical protein Hanom_Chr09g00789791 [Helianthus anomalus]
MAIRFTLSYSDYIVGTLVSATGRSTTFTTLARDFFGASVSASCGGVSGRSVVVERNGWISRVLSGLSDDAKATGFCGSVGKRKLGEEEDKEKNGQGLQVKKFYNITYMVPAVLEFYKVTRLGF